MPAATGARLERVDPRPPIGRNRKKPRKIRGFDPLGACLERASARPKNRIFNGINGLAKRDLRESLGDRADGAG